MCVPIAHTDIQTAEVIPWAKVCLDIRRIDLVKSKMENGKKIYDNTVTETNDRVQASKLSTEAT